MAKKIKKTAYVRCRGGGISCEYGCLGCGLCVSACRLGAISMEDSVTPEVNEKICVGCGLCARECPQGIIDIIDASYNIRPKCSSKDSGRSATAACPNSCISCGMCVRSCPAGAISLVEGVPVIDPVKCICCGMCAVKCPRGVIRDTYGIMTDAGR